MTTKTEPPKKYKVIGTRPIRHDGVDKVIGRAKFGSDIDLPGLLHGKVLRSPYAHAVIKSIDTSKAEAHPDVKAVVTATDLLPTVRVGSKQFLAQNWTDNVLARDKVLYKGHPIAAIAATSQHVAEEALSLIKVEYKRLPGVFIAEEAMKKDAPVLHPDMVQTGMLAGDEKYSLNTTAHERYKLGDFEKAMSKADTVVEREFRTKSVHQGYIELQNGTAWWTADGITVWCSSQGHFGIRDQVSRMTGMPIAKIKVVPMEIGGGFGGKLPVYVEPLAAVLSKKSGRPVKMMMSRSEVMEATGPTSGSYMRIKMGVDKQGRMLSAYAWIAFEAGAYPGSPITAAAAAVFAPYLIQDAQVDAYDVVVNKPKAAPYRAPGAPIVAYAVEQVVDELAEKLGMDPMQLRIKNAATEGDRRVDSVMNGRIGALETMEATKSHPHYNSKLTKKGANGRMRGRGVGMGFCRNNAGPASALATVNADGSVNLIEGSVDIGGSRTAVAQVLAEVLGIPVESVNPSIGDTDTIGFTSVTGGSGVAFKSGWAAHDAANDIKRQVISRAALIWDKSEKEIEYVDGIIQHKSDPELRFTFKEIAAQLNDTGGPVMGRANINPGGSTGSYSANIIDVEVDTETGKVDILRVTALQDVGRAIHPSYVEGQIQGGTAQGIGWALNEEYFLSDEGQMMNSSLLDYRMPTAMDLPMIDAVMVEVPNPKHPYGVKGVGEANLSAPLAAVANAIHDATGVRLTQLPMNPAAVLKALKEKQG
ncbi:MAG: xanthine dehydrogenase family protein molybdopterin-binding subunit [Chloroflexi bacterium]|nr:xanthine dehydrogenase family protein molybdopterin-binding subunit [Chloroflexota bacterium]